MLRTPACVGVAAVLVLAAPAAYTETFVEQSAEFRMQLDFVVPDAALKKFRPTGWEPNVATQGPAKDCNLRMIFIDRVDITGAVGAPIGSNRLVYLAAPVKQSGTSNAGQMIIAGLTADPKDAPGPFGNFEHATTVRKGGAEVKFFSPTNPSSYQIFKVEQGLDIMRNATVPVRDRVKEFSYKAGGGRLGALFDGSERVVSIDSFHWYNRGVYLP